MQRTLSTNPASSIPVPKIDSEGPVAVIPAASVAPLDGPPDGERINIFMVAPPREPGAFDSAGAAARAHLRQRVLRKPLTSVAIAFAIGLMVARVLR